MTSNALAAQGERETCPKDRRKWKRKMELGWLETSGEVFIGHQVAEAK